MNLDAAQIDRIVQEVVRQLQTQSTAVRDRDTTAPSPAMPAIPGLSVPSVTAPTAVTSPASQRGTSDANRLVLVERLITGELVRGRLAGIECVQVECRAVVTPLVNDLLRERKIRLERRASPLAAQRMSTETTARHTGSKQASAAASAIRRIGLYAEPLSTGAIWTPMAGTPSVEWTRMANADELLRSLGNQRASCCCGVAITRSWASLVRTANQHPSIRAAVVWSSHSVQQAIAQLKPNLLVIDAAHAHASDVDAWVALAVNESTEPK